MFLSSKSCRRFTHRVTTALCLRRQTRHYLHSRLNYTELHNQHLEDLFLEDFDIALPRPKAAASPARKRTFEGRLKSPTPEAIDLD